MWTVVSVVCLLLPSMLWILSPSFWYQVRGWIGVFFAFPLEQRILIMTTLLLGIPTYTRTQKYIEALTAKTKPKKILVCMIYYPDMNNVPSWANSALGALDYNQNPVKLQLLIRKMFEEATR